MDTEEEISKSEFKKGRMEQAARKKKLKMVFWIAAPILVIGLIIFGIVRYSSYRARNLPGVSYPAQGQEHVTLNASFDYNSNPPSSGPHYGQPANWGTYDYEVNDKIFIHNLEHGGIWITYRSSVSSKAIEDLKKIAEEFSGSKIVMAPRSANDTDIAVAAWMRVLKFNLSGDTLSDTQKDEIKEFYRRLKNHGPEFVPETMPGVDPKEVQGKE